MSFVLLNDWRVPIALNSGSLKRKKFGMPDARWTGMKSRNRTTNVDSYSFETIPLNNADAEFLEAMLEGRGHHWDFDDDAWSESGIGPESGSTYTLPAGGVYGTNYLSITGGNKVTYDTRHVGLWTVMYWRDVTGTPEHVAVRCDGAKWSDGVRNDALSTPELTVGILEGFDIDGPIEIDDLVFVYAEVPGDVVAKVAASASAFSPLPAIRVGGDFLNGDERLFLGEHKGSSFLQANMKDGFKNNLRTVSFQILQK